MKGRYVRRIAMVMKVAPRNQRDSPPKKSCTTPMAIGISHNAPPMASERMSCARIALSGAPFARIAASSASRIGLKVRR